MLFVFSIHMRSVSYYPSAISAASCCWLTFTIQLLLYQKLSCPTRRKPVEERCITHASSKEENHYILTGMEDFTGNSRWTFLWKQMHERRMIMRFWIYPIWAFYTPLCRSESINYGFTKQIQASSTPLFRLLSEVPHSDIWFHLLAAQNVTVLDTLLCMQAILSALCTPSESYASILFFRCCQILFFTSVLYHIMLLIR